MDKDPTWYETRAQEIFTDCLEHPEASRREWALAQCGDDQRLAKEVRGLLDAQTAGAGFLDSAQLRGLADTENARLAGVQAGPWRLRELIGTGGMGAVYRGERADGAYEQEVAIKVVPSGFLGSAAVTRFEAERQILARLQHPGIARLIDGGTTPEGHHYLVMEYVEGRTLVDHCNHHALDLRERLKLIQQVCEVLHHAHESGIVHRDIKPGNIMVTAAGQARLLDFGIAKVLDAAVLAGATPQTRTGAAAMTVQYASPEQIRCEPITAASDIYSLGLVLYELVTGCRPYSVEGVSPADAERTVCDSVPDNPSRTVQVMPVDPPPGLKSRVQLRRRLHGDLDRIVMTALRKTPSNRYENALALSADLERFMAGKPVEVRGASALYRLRKFSGRHKAAVGATAAAFLAMLSALVVVTWQAREATQQRDLAQAQAERAEAASGFLFDMIDRVDPFTDGAEMTLIGALKASIPDIETSFQGQPLLQAQLHFRVGYALQNLGEVEASRQQLDAALALFRQVGSKLDQARAYDGLGLVDWWESDFDQAERNFRRALSLLEGDSSQEARALGVDVLVNAAGMLNEPGEYERALDYLDRAERWVAEAGLSDGSMLATLYNNRATTEESLGDNDAALRSYDLALKYREESDGRMHPDYAITLNNLSFIYTNAGNFERAAELLEESTRIRRALLGDRHPQVVTSLVNLAWVEGQAGHLDRAEKAAREAVSIALERYGPAHIRTAKALETLAGVLLLAERYDEAVQEANAALNIYGQNPDARADWVEAARSIRDEAQATLEAAPASP